MALTHRATLTPSKPELLDAWLPGRPWYDGPGDLQQVGAYRFDDPAGEVGLEAFVLRAADRSLLHVPVTCRADPVWLAALASAVLTDRWARGWIGSAGRRATPGTALIRR